MPQPAEIARDDMARDASLTAVMSKRAQQTIATYYLVNALISAAKKLHKKWQASTQYTVSISADDDLYGDLHDWLLDRMPPRNRRALHAKSQTSGRLVPVSNDRWERNDEPGLVRLYYDSARQQTVDLDGHRILVEMERGEWGGEQRWVRQDKVVFTCPSIDARDALVAQLAELAKAQTVRTPKLAVASRWGEFGRRSNLAPRPLESVVLPAGQMGRIVEDLERFLAAEDDYERLGIPWHRGILLHGPPGTGKTSIARTLAWHLNLDVYYVPLSDLDDDSRLLSLLTEVPPRSMLLLEDIDVVHAARERDDQAKGVSASGLLQALDGFVTPHGMITCMTTNNLSVLDPALIRKGRADVVEEVTYLTDDQLRQIVEMVTGRPGMIPKLDGREISAAEIIEACKPHLDDPDAAYNAIWELLGTQMTST